MTRHNAWRDGHVHVKADRCPTCIFRPGNLMHLQPGRLADMVADACAADSAIICHDTLDGDNAVCRGFADSYVDRVLPLRLGQALHLIEEDP